MRSSVITASDAVEAVVSGASEPDGGLSLSAAEGIGGAPVTVSGIRGAAPMMVALLARWMGAEADFADPERLEADLPSGSRERPAMVVVPAGELAVRVAEVILGRFRAALRAGVCFEELPAATLVSARDEASLSWLIAKLIVAQLRPVCLEQEARIHVITPLESGSRWSAVRPGSLWRGRCVDHQDLDADAAVAMARQDCEVLVTTTHGLDACANGGGGFVLCGLNRTETQPEAGAKGVLACAQGFACPRGSHPLALREFGARTLMLGSCNGLRVGDGSLRSDFNLGLSFLDGVGEAYCSSINSSSGGEMAVTAFAAATASGQPFSSAVACANIAIASSGLDDVCFLGIGNPASQSALLPDDPSDTYVVTDNGPQLIDGGGRWLLRAEIDEPVLIERAKSKRLRWSIESVDGLSEPVRWCQAIESRGGRELLRLWIFGFPEPLQTLRLEPLDEAVVKTQVDGSLRALDRWLELWRAAKLEDCAERSGELLWTSRCELAASLATLMGRLRFDGSAYGSIKQLQDRAAQIGSSTRDMVISRMAPRLATPFWLTNVYSAEYHTIDFQDDRCMYCRSPALLKRRQHPLHQEARLVLVCNRCGILMDRLEVGRIQSLTLDGDDVVKPGGTLRIVVGIDATNRISDIVVVPRLSTIAQADVLSEPPDARWGGSPLEFEFIVPSNLPPHRYFVKAIAAANDEISFASRPFYVVR